MKNSSKDPMTPVCSGWEVEGYPDHPEIAIDTKHKPEQGWESLLGCVVEMQRPTGSVKVQLVEYRWQEDATWDGVDEVHAGMFFSYECGPDQTEPHHIVLGDNTLIWWAGAATGAVDAIEKMERELGGAVPHESWDELGDNRPRYVRAFTVDRGEEMFYVVCPNGEGVKIVRDRIHEKIRKRDEKKLAPDEDWER